MKAKRTCLIGLSVLVLVFGTCLALYAAEYPSKPINFIITFKVGGAADIEARTLIKEAEKYVKVPIIPINKTGAGGSIGFEAIRTAKPDGYTVGFFSASLLTHTNIGNLPGTWQDWDYATISLVEATSITVRYDAPWKNFSEFMEYARKNPGKVKIGNGGTGSFTYLTAVALQKAANIKCVDIPEGVRRVPAVLSGEVDAISVHPPEVLALHKGKKVRMLAISAPERISAYQDIPTFKEFGWDVGFYQYRGVILPKGVPVEIVQKLESIFLKAARSDKFKALANKKGFAFYPGDSRKFIDFTRQNNENIKGIIEKIGIKK